MMRKLFGIILIISISACSEQKNEKKLADSSQVVFEKSSKEIYPEVNVKEGMLMKWGNKNLGIDTPDFNLSEVVVANNTSEKIISIRVVDVQTQNALMIGIIHKDTTAKPIEGTYTVRQKEESASQPNVTCMFAQKSKNPIDGMWQFAGGTTIDILRCNEQELELRVKGKAGNIQHIAAYENGDIQLADSLKNTSLHLKVKKISISYQK